ncbi:MAG: hypothetical protein IJO64_01740 [Clostridia bacterium]|nr:hypothetical protein [Clostridia bacterium]
MKKAFKLTALILVFSIALGLSSCSFTEKPETDLEFVVYENNGTDMISFYMTSIIDNEGVWDYYVDSMYCIKEFHNSEETKEFGFMGMGGTASYKTIIFKPVAVGEQEIQFRLNNADARIFKLKVTADKDDIYRIKCEEIKKK